MNEFDLKGVFDKLTAKGISEISIDDIANNVFDTLETMMKNMHPANILITGKAGTGKSTLINSVFSKNLATEGNIEPTTIHTAQYSIEDYPVKIWDTRGIELSDAKANTNYGPYGPKEAFDEIKRIIKKQDATQNPDEMIDCIWYCVSQTTSGSVRFEDSEENLLKQLVQDSETKRIPIIIVITQAMHKNKAEQVAENIRERKMGVKQVIPVLARDIVDEDDGTLIKKSYGLDKLVDFTNQVLPEAKQEGFIQAQKVAMKKKDDLVEKIILGAATTAGGAGAVPIPFSDAFAIFPVQTAMFGAIAKVYCVEVSKSVIEAVAGSIIGGLGATFAGKMLVKNIVKFIPGANIAMGVVSATTAFALTKAIGDIFKKILRENYGKKLDDTTVEYVSSYIKEEVKKTKGSIEVNAECN